jgi:SAM-dependent methyltransferase
MKQQLRHWMADPTTRGMDLDDPSLTQARREILQNKKFLRALYTEWYAGLFETIPAGPGAVVELGSGAGFMDQLYSQVIASEVFWLPEVKLVLDACALPFAAGSLKAILMTDVFHPIPCARSFFAEAIRCLRPGGVVAMVEPWRTPWSSLVYHSLHHEPFDPAASAWEFAASGPLSGANGALPWIVFERDREQFVREFPCLRVALVRPLMPFSYLVSGGLSMRGLTPAWSYRGWRLFEGLLDRWRSRLGMFAQIVLEKTPC